MTAVALPPSLAAWLEADDDAIETALPPYADVRPEHYAPAFERAWRAHRAEIEALAAAPGPAGFDDTALALDRSGRALRRLEGLLDMQLASVSTPALQAVDRALAGPRAGHWHAVRTHAGLYARLAAVAARAEALGLDSEQRRLVERLRLDHERAGAALAPERRAEVGRWIERLAELTTAYAQQVLADEARSSLRLRAPDDLAGLPDDLCAATRAAALERGETEPGLHLLPPTRSYVIAFLASSRRRDLREAAWRAWTYRGVGPDPARPANAAIAREILSLRAQLAAAHGQPSYAAHALRDAMAGSPQAVRALLDSVGERARRRFEAERAELETYAERVGEPLPLQPWDWRALGERLRADRYGLDAAQLKPYFPLQRMIDAAFDAASRLFGLRFVRREGVAAWHADVQCYEVRDARDGDALLGLFLRDDHARPGKRSGAWMCPVRLGHDDPSRPGRRVPAIASNHNNFARGTAEQPTLLSHDDARTLFHEFGHALHGLLSTAHHERLSGTNVLRDFVELPSQLYEYWLDEPNLLMRHARHVQTGEPIPPALVDRLRAAQRFHQGYETLRYVGSALVDLALHEQAPPPDSDPSAAEAAELARLGIPPLAGVNHHVLHFQHVFGGWVYEAGYYVYLWAEVLSADAHEAFVEAGDPYDPALASRLRRWIYGSGDTLDPGSAYRAFRGREASPEAVLRERGLLEPEAPA